MDDPEAIFQEGWMLCDVGEHKAGLLGLQRAVDNGYFPVPTLERPRSSTRCGTIPVPGMLADARTRRDAARAAFREAGGDRLLGLP